ncbi:MAG: SOUL heme-binding protein-domain-containing protein [Monoraphidium minutum]|nr:MAG: SOUL heme-binding protein-domain-containing protein [Monoraphidium minutum]
MLRQQAPPAPHTVGARRFAIAPPSMPPARPSLLQNRARGARAAAPPRAAAAESATAGSAAATAAGVGGQSLPRPVLAEARAFLDTELRTLFTPQGAVTRSRYSGSLHFEDPITRLDSLDAYVLMVGALKTLFSITFELHTLEATGPDEITARWTMSCLVRPLPWQPTAVFTGRSFYKVDPASGLITSQRDTWDSLSNSSFLSLEALALLMRQALDLTQTPDLETPRYRVLKAGRGYEIRKYDPFIVAEVPMGDGSTPSTGGGFNELAGYIFGRNSSSEKMEMTTPVLSEPGDGGALMQFPMEERFPSVSALPAPLDTRVATKEIGARYVAATRFSGWALDWEVQSAERELRRALLRDGLAPAAGYRLARYNDPLTPPPLRRNEVLVDLPEFEWPQ